MWGRESVWGEWGSVLACGGGRVYGVSGEVCWRVGEVCVERNGGGVRKCGERNGEVWGPNTLPPTLSHTSSLP